MENQIIRISIPNLYIVKKPVKRKPKKKAVRK